MHRARFYLNEQQEKILINHLERQIDTLFPVNDVNRKCIFLLMKNIKQGDVRRWEVLWAKWVIAKFAALSAIQHKKRGVS